MLQSKLPPIVLTKRPINSGEAQKYATMEYNVSGKGKLTEYFAMLLKALVVRSTRQKDESLSEDSKKSWKACLHYSEMSYYHLHGTDKMIAIAIEGIVAHGQGGNQGKYLVL
jgi:hypothetical protein